MTKVTNISLRQGENWRIDFSAHQTDGTTVMPLISGATVNFRLSRIDADGNVENILTLYNGNGVFITDEDEGEAAIQVTTEQQDSLGISSDEIYYYEIETIVGETPSIQAEGRLNVERSLFAQVVDPLLILFQAHFPEFTEDDSTIEVYLKEAIQLVATDEWIIGDQPLATIYLAAHLLQMRKLASILSSSGGVQVGDVKSITVEDRTVTFMPSTSSNRTTATSSQFSLGSTVYGQRYLAMLRRNPRFLWRA